MFCYFFGILYYRSGKNLSEWFFLFSLFLDLSQHILARKEPIIVFSNFLKFLTIFSEISITGRVGTRRNDFFFIFLFYLFLSLSQLILAWKEAIMVFFYFLNFFAIFLEFSILGWVETHRNDFFCFLSFSAFPNIFWLEKNP